jgi:hypothetical protein
LRCAERELQASGYKLQAIRYWQWAAGCCFFSAEFKKELGNRNKLAAYSLKPEANQPAA